MLLILTICYEFFKIGLFAVGGGLATLPFLYDLADKYPWFTKEELINMIAVSESTPGPIGINMATYVGFTSSGVIGALASTLSLVLPSYVIIVIISKMLDRFKNNKYVIGVFDVIRPCVCALITIAVLEVYKASILIEENFNLDKILYCVDYKNFLVFGIITFLVFKFKKNPILYIGLGAVVGILLKL